MAEHAGPATRSAVVDTPPQRAVDVVVVGAGPAGSAAALVLARAGPLGRAARARPVPRLQEHVRRRGLRPHPRRADPRAGGRRCRCSAGSPAAPRWCSPPTQSLTIDFRTQALGRRRRTTAAPRSAPTSTAGWPARRTEAGAVLVPSTIATGLRRDASGAVVGVRTDRPDGDIDAPSRDRLRRRQLVPGQGGRPVRPTRPEHFTLGVKEVLRPAPPRHRRALRPHRRRGRRLRDPRAAPATSPAAASSTPTSTRSRRRGAGPAGLARSGRPARGVHRRAEGAPGDRAAGRGRRAEGVLGPPHPRGRLRRHARAGGRRPAGRRRRRRVCLAAGIWLEGVNFAIGSGCPRARPPPTRWRPATPRRPGWPATAGGWTSRSCSRTTEAAPRARTRAVRAGAAALSRRWCATSSRGCSPSTTRAKPGLRKLIRRVLRCARRQDSGTSCRDALTGVRTFG